jgi:hypothetical protein
MATKPLVLLYEANGIGLVILYPSGVLYSNQVGGVSCLKPEVEGIYVPLVNEVLNQEKMLNDYFTGIKWMGGCSGNMDFEDADFIDEVLAKSVFSSFIKVDREKLSESCEAWVYVKLAQQPAERPQTYDGLTQAGKTASGNIIRSEDFDMDVILYPIYGFGETAGILTWANSD